MNKEHFGKLILFLRQAKQLSQKDLANALHVTPPSVCKWEQGKTLPDIYMLENIAKFFQVSCDDLYHPEDTLQRLTSSEPSQDNVSLIKTSKMFNSKIFWFVTSFTLLFVIISIFILININRSPFKLLENNYISHDNLGYVYQIEYSIFSEQSEELIDKHAEKTYNDWKSSSLSTNEIDAVSIIYHFNYTDENSASIPDCYYYYINY